MNKKLTLLAIGFVILITSCSKSDRDEDITTSSVVDNALFENLWIDAQSQIENAAFEEDSLRDGDCPEVTIDLTSEPMTVTVDFGEDGCTGDDGRERKGVLLATFTGKYSEEGSVITVTPQDYSVDGYALEGTRTVTNEGENEDGNTWFSVSVSDAKITHPSDNWFTTWESERTRTWVKGDDTPMNPWDDEYEIEGTAHGQNRNGNTYEMEITSPLWVKVGCPWIVKGTLEIQPDNLSLRTIDYGNGTCNGNITVTINGVDFEVNLE